MFKPDFKSPDWVDDHLKAYLADGVEAHLLDLSRAGGSTETPTLVLRTVGRKSGRTLLSPLVYGKSGDDIILIASKGGAPKHPAWYHNLAAADRVEYKLMDECWSAAPRVAEGEERERLWQLMVGVFAGFDAYRAKTDREIPVIVLKPLERIPALSA